MTDARQSGSKQGGAAVPDTDKQSQGTVNDSALGAHAEAALRIFHIRRALAGVLLRQLVVTNTADPVQGLIRAGLLAARLGTPPPQSVEAARACHA